MALMGYFFEKMENKSDYVVYSDFMLETISCQYSHLVIVAWIHLTEIKEKRGEPRR